MTKSMYSISHYSCTDMLRSWIAVDRCWNMPTLRLGNRTKVRYLKLDNFSNNQHFLYLW